MPRAVRTGGELSIAFVRAVTCPHERGCEVLTSEALRRRTAAAVIVAAGILGAASPSAAQCTIYDPTTPGVGPL